MPNFISEDDIEKAILQRFQQLGFELLNCYTTDADDLNDGSQRADKRDVIFRERLKAGAVRLNPNLPETAINKALSILIDQRYAKSRADANREVDSLIRDGVSVEYENSQGKTTQGRVRVIDFNEFNGSTNALGCNEYLAVSQLWIKGEQRYRRPDIILYINGLPVVFIELKNSNVKLKTAFDDNLRNYKQDIPQLFLTNAFCILSNAIETKVGSFTATWKYFFNWLRVEDEKEKINRDEIEASGTSLQRAVDGICNPPKILDFIENFVIYHNQDKIIAQNHQFIGVNSAIDAFIHRKEKQGKLGVFWHTPGAGKSFSMIFYARKIFRKFTGNYTFVIVTDRDDLDRQIYRNFLNTETIKANEAAQPQDGEEMRKFLSQNKRIVFTLIQKFRYAKGKKYPILSSRDDIIVIVDEAHRTQYKSLAENMRAGLPNANYLAFTGTPLLGKERKTNTWFGDYISEYNFSQSIKDGATVPLFYEKRVPEVLMQNDNLSDEFYQIIEDENLNDAQRAKLERKFARQTEVIKRDDRLEAIAQDIVYHFPRRGYLGKGMVVTLDKFTAVKMYDKVQFYWKAEIKKLHRQIYTSRDDIEKTRLKKILDFMRDTEMAVIVSSEAGEEDKFNEQGLSIKPHRERMQKLDAQGHDIEYQFKDPENPLRLVFVCAMWLTGFDVPTMNTLYLDKPMKNHTLMQTIARANRVSSYSINNVIKTNGEIIDYYNVFRNMKQALADYTPEEREGKSPVQEKSNLFKLLDDAIAQGFEFCLGLGIDLKSVLNIQDIFKNLEQFKRFADKLLQKDEWYKAFTVYDNTITSLYGACKPEILKQPALCEQVAVFQYLRGVIDSIIERQDINNASLKIAALLDESVVTDYSNSPKDAGTKYQTIRRGKIWDLSQMDFQQLKAGFPAVTYKNIEITDLRSFIQNKLNNMIQQNATRTDFAQRLQNIIDKYNSGASATEDYYEALINFAENLKVESERHIREGLSEDELEIFDLLKKDKMTVAETQKVKLAAKYLLQRLTIDQPKVLVQDWYRDALGQNQVKSTVEEILDNNLPESYDKTLFQIKCNTIFDLIYTYARIGQKWAA